MHYKRMRKHGTTDARVFVPKDCAVDGCDRRANVPGSARGWCGPHYQRWQRWGDPLGEYAPRIGIAPCAIEGCEDLVKARGWCVRHYTRWERRGDPLPRLQGEVVGGCRICPSCGVDKPLAYYGKARAYCKPCTAARTAAYRLVNPPALVVGQPAECRRCGTVFMANKRRSTYCSRDCFEAHRYKADWKNQANRRARMVEALVESFDRIEIFERDGWVCQICDAPVDPDAPQHSYSVPSIDHIIPIARGGEHSRANVQTACLGCNVRKGVSVA
jgi:hypothetical protein